jgi:transcriptional regulator with PAS, ATPase and Fis domain
MREVVRLATRVAATDSNVLITGESGTGKERVARFIHARSRQSPYSFLKIDCAALPGDLLEAELFGYERGAFTGATQTKPGRIEGAHKGTLVLDEIAYLPIDAQAKLLRVIARREFERLGGRRTHKVDARIIALTNVDLEEAIRRRAFREDLYYRLNVVHLRLPPLRERRADIRRLAQEFLKIDAAKHGRPAKEIAPDALAILEAYEFPGNVRELANVIERAVVVSNDKRIEATDLPETVRAIIKLQKERQKRRTLAELEAEYIAETLQWAHGNKSEAARSLGISRKNLYEKIARYRLEV